MRRIFAVVATLLALGPARSAGAQDRQWPERIWISVSGGIQTAGSGFDDAFDVPLYAETERVTVDYPAKGGGLFAARGGYRVWKRLTIGAGVTHFSRRADAQVQAQLPHPFFDNQFRLVEGATSVLRAETGGDVLIGWMQPLSDRLRVIVTAGPSFLNVEQTVVTDVEFSETYPYDTAEFTGAATRRATRRATGFNAGADVMWMFSRRFGAGALVQYTHARARLGTGTNRSISVDLGGVQAAGGLRLTW